MLDLASPPTGAPLLSGVGDIGGFRHDDLDVSPADGMFANPIFGNTTSLDFAESAPLIVARVGTSSSPAGRPAPTPPTAERPGRRLPRRRREAAGSGSIAVSADGKHVRLGSQEGDALVLGRPRRHLDRFHRAHRGDVGRRRSGQFLQVLRGRSERDVREHRRRQDVQCRRSTTSVGRPRPVFGIEGDVWVPTSNGLLHSQDSGATFPAVAAVNGATAVGFGMPVCRADLPGGLPGRLGERRLGHLPLRRRRGDLAAPRRRAAPVRLHQLPGRRSPTARPGLSRHLREGNRLWRPAMKMQRKTQQRNRRR